MPSISAAERASDQSPEIDSRGFGADLWVGTGVAALLTMGLVVWSAFAPLPGAVIAPASVLNEILTRPIRHPDGGVVTEINVQEGAEVKEGDVLIRLDDTPSRTSYESIQTGLDKAHVHLARLAAESEGRPDFRLPPELLARAHLEGTAGVIAAEQALFDARMQTLGRERAKLRQLITQLEAQVVADSFRSSSQEFRMSKATTAIEKHAGVAMSDYASFAALFPVAPLDPASSSTGSLVWGHIASARERIAETELEILRIEERFRSESLRDLADAEARVASLEEKLTGAESRIRGLELRAPSGGMVYDLQIHDLGVVVGPGETILTLVPRVNDPLIEARVRPQDIDQVVVGQKLFVRFPAFKRNATLEVAGTVILVGADVTVDPPSKQTRQPTSRPPYYSVRIGLRHDQLSQLDGARMMPGMPAEIFIRTANRTALSHIIRSFSVR